MASQDNSPNPPSRASSRSSRKSLKLDLSNLPALTQPTPPSNTLIFTNLQERDIFRPDNLQRIRELVAQTAPIHTWAPLKSFRRVVVSFFSEDDAIKVRGVWDGGAIMGERCRVYFGQATPLNISEKDMHLALPDAGKLFFISPPPSPPHDWEMRLEGAPNKMVHAEDLADALAKLHHHKQNSMADSPISPLENGSGFASRTRSRSSTLIYEPKDHGSSSNLPSISLDDMTDSPVDVDMYTSPVAEPKPIMAHTARPPVEFMHSA